jgi:hypothetical protein
VLIRNKILTISETFSGSHTLTLGKDILISASSSFSHTLTLGKDILLTQAFAAADVVNVITNIPVLVTETFSGAVSVVTTNLQSLGKARVRLHPRSFLATLLKLKGKGKLTDDG